MLKKTIADDESKERSKKILRFGLIALIVMLINSMLDFHWQLPISGGLVLLMAFLLCFILLAIHKGYVKGILTAIVLTVNPFLVLVAFAEGLQTGGYLFILPLLFALAFLMGNARVLFFEMAAYFFITICAFCICILLCNETSKWQHVPPELASHMFVYNSICVVCLCALFAYTGIYFQRQYEAALLAAKNYAEMQQQQIKKQNEHLQEIAFMNAHVLRLPVANILALTSLIKQENVTGSIDKEMIAHLQTSTQQLDDAIKKIVSKTGKEFVVTNG